jgi:4-amino-4-deoxy-L-arabinose transferase-like glycosyltransferase
LVALGVTAAILTELLSLFHAVRWGPLVVAWGLVLLAGGVVARRRWAVGHSKLERPGVFDSLLAAGIGAIALITAAVALLSPPNSVDAFGYHLSRVVYWAQAGSVAFFPTHYFNQISMPPLAEYVTLHGYVLSGGDHLVNLVQWAGFMGSVIGVSLIAEALGAGRRGQMLASVFCATLPNGILQASGAKNDCMVALYLVAMVYFALRFAAKGNRADGLWTGLALGLALLTKATAYLFAPALLLGATGIEAWRKRAQFARAIPLLIVPVVALNGPQWWRNFDLSGSMLGFPSAQEDGRFRWTNDRFGIRTTASNMLRNGSQQLGARSPAWNRGVYQAVLRADRWLGIDANDPATTWPGPRFAPPVNSNHEADAPNRWHLLLLAAALLPILVSGRKWLGYYCGIVLAFALFSATLKYQPFFGRVLLPLFVVGAPVFGVLAERIRPVALQVLLCLLLFDQTRHALFQNWTRPLTGPSSILRTARNDNYFRDMDQFGVTERDYQQSVEIVAERQCRDVGIDNGQFQLEYPFQALMLQRTPRVRFFHAGVTNASAKYAQQVPSCPCAILCLGCAGVRSKIEQFSQWGDPVQVNRFLIYLPACRAQYFWKKSTMSLVNGRRSPPG